MSNLCPGLPAVLVLEVTSNPPPLTVVIVVEAVLTLFAFSASCAGFSHFSGDQDYCQYDNFASKVMNTHF